MSWSARAGGRLSPRELHIFLTVAEARTMAKAADSLAMSRPVVSRAIAALEHRVGQALFDRAARGVRLTGAGEILRQHAFAVFDALRQAGVALDGLRDPGSGELRLAASEPFAAGIVGPAIGAMHAKYAGLRVELESVTPDEMPVYLRERRGDLVVTRVTEAPMPDDIAVRPLMRESLVVVAGRQSSWARRRRIRLQDLIEAPWILSRFETGPTSPFVRSLKEAGLELPKRLIIANSVNLRLHLLSAGEHVTLIPGSALTFGPVARYVARLPVVLPPWERGVAVLTLRGRTLSAAASAFILVLDQLIEQVPGLRSEPSAAW